MTNFSKIKSMTVDELAEWLDKNSQFDTSPWLEDFNEKYCRKCEPIKVGYEDSKKKLGLELFSYEHTTDCAYCELYNKCRFFEDLEDIPDNKEMIKLWLIEEAEHEDM